MSLTAQPSVRCQRGGGGAGQVVHLHHPGQGSPSPDLGRRGCPDAPHAPHAPHAPARPHAPRPTPHAPCWPCAGVPVWRGALRAPAGQGSVQGGLRSRHLRPGAPGHPYATHTARSHPVLHTHRTQPPVRYTHRTQPLVLHTHRTQRAPAALPRAWPEAHARTHPRRVHAPHRTPPPLPPHPPAAALLPQVTLAVEYLHSVDVVHRDLKAAEIVV